MKKSWKKICGVCALSAMLAVSATAYASETTLLIEPTEGEDEMILDGNEENTNEGTEQANAAEDSVRTRIIIRERKETDTETGTETEITAREITMEQLIEEIQAGVCPELAAVIVEKEEENNSGAEREMQSENITENGFLQESVQEGFVGEEENETDSQDFFDLPVIQLDEAAEELIYEAAEMVPQTIVLTNQCSLENEWMFADCDAVKAVKQIQEQTPEDVLIQVRDFDLEQEYLEYVELMALAKNARTRTTGQTETSENKAPKTGSGNLNGSGSTGSSPNTESTPNTGDTNPTSNPNSLTVQKDVTITLVPDEILEEDDYITATYQIASTKEITSGKITITYDKTLMTYSDVEASDALDGLMTSVKAPGTAGVEEGKIEFEFSSTTPKKLDGDLIDLTFDLPAVAEVGKEFNITLTVNELKNGSQNLTSEVKTERMIVLADTDSDDDEETPSTPTPAPQSETPATEPPAATTPTPAPDPVNAPKTGDETRAVTFLLAAFCSAAIFGKMRKRA